VEPSARAIELANDRITRAPFPVEVVGLNGELLPLDDNSVECVVSTFTLCTIPDVAQALSEVARVLVPGGTLHVLEHGLGDDEDVRRWQHRLDPLQQRMAGGCHLIRHVPSMLSDAGFDVVEISRWYEGRPRSFKAMTRALATPRVGLA
jgi:SAM-dependent methyltransferase